MCSVSTLDDNWDKHFVPAESGNNNRVHACTGFPPIYLTNNHNPHNPLLLLALEHSRPPSGAPGALDFPQLNENLSRGKTRSVNGSAMNSALKTRSPDKLNSQKETICPFPRNILKCRQEKTQNQN